MADRELEAIGDTFQELEAFRELEAAAAGNELLRAEEGTGTDRVADKALLLEPAQQVDMAAAVFRQREHGELNMKHKYRKQ